MVYCSKCGTKNMEDAQYCIKCGANLEASREKRFEKRAEEWGEEFGRRAEEWGKRMEREFRDECFGLPHGGAIVGLIIGVIVLIVGLSLIPGLVPANVRATAEAMFGPIIVIIFGILLLAGALYGLSRRM